MQSKQLANTFKGMEGGVEGARGTMCTQQFRQARIIIR